MHELFANVLAKRDLSRAGELFSLDDDKIVDGLTDVVSKHDFRPHNLFLNFSVRSKAGRNLDDYRTAAIFGKHKRSVSD